MKRITIALIVLALLAGCSTANAPKETQTPTPTETPVATEMPSETDEPTATSDSVSVNRADMKGYTLLTDKEHAFVSMTMVDSLAFIESGEEGILYYGYAGCPFCQQAVPVLNDAAKELGYTVYYIDLYAEENKSDKEENQKAFEEIYAYSEAFLSTDADGNKGFFVPQVSVVDEGKIIDTHIGVAPSAESANMDSDQRKELKDIYTKMFEKLK